MHNTKTILIIIALLIAGVSSSQAQTDPTKSDPAKYVFERDEQVMKKEPGPHKGGGESIGYTFFDKAPGYHTVFKKRTLKSGSAIGYHQQTEDEVYYIIEGKGVITLNGEKFPVKPGDAILTRTGSSHGIAPVEGNDLSMIIVYEKKQ